MVRVKISASNLSQKFRFFVTTSSHSSESHRLLLFRPSSPSQYLQTPPSFSSSLSLFVRPWSSASPAPSSSVSEARSSSSYKASPSPSPSSSEMESSKLPPDYDDCVFDADDKDYKGEPESDPEETYLFSPSDSEN